MDRLRRCLRAYVASSGAYEPMTHAPSQVKNEKKAAKIFKRAVELGNVDAAMRLGILYCEGEGVKVDKKKAMKLFRMAADRGDAKAQHLLSRELNAEFLDYADAEMAKLEAKPASERREVDEDAVMARLNAARLSSDEEVHRYCRLSAEQGYVPAMRPVSHCYSKGIGVERDVDEARRWLERAAAAGDAKSIAELEKLNA